MWLPTSIYSSSRPSIVVLYNYDYYRKDGTYYNLTKAGHQKIKKNNVELLLG